jgi:hypothetical protein
MKVRCAVAGVDSVIGVAASAGSGGSTVSNKPVTTEGGATGGTSKPARAMAHVGATVAVSSGNDKSNVTLVKVIDPATGADQFTNPSKSKRTLVERIGGS